MKDQENNHYPSNRHRGAGAFRSGYRGAPRRGGEPGERGGHRGGRGGDRPWTEHKPREHRGRGEVRRTELDQPTTGAEESKQESAQ